MGWKINKSETWKNTKSFRINNGGNRFLKMEVLCGTNDKGDDSVV